jgi:protein-tyrosine phosphatase
MADVTRVLFVCMGNICRSPTAEGVFRNRVEKAGMQERIHIDSAGTHDYHVGDPPDPRSCAAAMRRGYDLSALRARQVRREDFVDFDYVLPMDEVNFRHLERLCPEAQRSKLRMFVSFSGQDVDGVPDPYYGGAQGFDRVLDLIEDAADGLLKEIAARIGGTA